ncbi:hypothetical protein BJ875DRAFT_150513 [Amylocarpus encephaloides]|uniref:Uncharacterized protein n=1 Tax=Amylocarpus encephaloides TaxID=45428 RepID=A0A9P7YCC3_9HELO|nr:hypothetical protein BJ875DRAFT_150513 [Amylocarpus encephaloides]
MVRLFVDEKISIIAIHGHGGHYITSFTHRTTSCFLLKDLLPPLLSPRPLRILSFSYSKNDEDRLGAEAIATLFLRLLTQNRAASPDRPIFWLAHSFGGPLLQGVLSADGSEGVDSVRGATRGIFFFGVEKGGGGWANFVKATDDGEQVSEELMKLRRELEWLGRCEVRYRELFRERGWIVKWFMESEGEDVLKLKKKVENEQPNVMYMTKSHGRMVQFEGEECEEWKRVRTVLLEVVEGLKEKPAVEVPAQSVASE